MCGIAGFITLNSQPEDQSVLKRMTGVIAHRGPDDNGFYTDEHAFLGHRRLSIIDLATGQQPMSNENGNCWIIYNGEVFNHASLRPELEAAGHRYKSHSDTETILHAYEQYGPESLSRFRGMFSFVIWDKASRTLFCARDRLGIKPFYYFFNGRLFAFASEIKALLQHPAVSTEPEETALSEYLAFGYLSGEETLFRGIHKLMPGHHMTLRVRGQQIERRTERYWDAPFAPPASGPSDEDWIRECRERLEETVNMRLMSDVPLGVFLSGGLDSSAIAALMKRMVSGPLKTFSVGYQERQYSELGFARQVAGHIGSEHHEVVVGMEDFFNSLPKLVWHEDEPIVWPSSISLYFVSKLASENVKVVLTGEGSDELFAGYARYAHYLFNQRWLPYYQWLPGGLRSLIRGQIAASSLLSATVRRKLQHTFLGLGEDLPSLLLDNFYCAFSAKAQQSLLEGQPGAAYENYLRYWNAAGGAPQLQRLLYADQKTYLVELLMKQDQMSMACSIESRVPLLDHTFVEFAAGVPPNLKLRGAGKYIFKKAVEDILPHEIIYRRKMGFPTPLRQWFREERAQPLYDLLRDPAGLIAEYVNPAALEELIRSQQEGRQDCTDRLWRLLNLQIWGDVFLTKRLGPESESLLGPVPAAALQ
ncbi:MAG: asparagine synthase (glutamine-hydrolyzing) [Bryobacteraceae bacterium]